MAADLFVVLGGGYSFLLVVFHLLFWKLFNWQEELALLSPINRAVMQILNLCMTAAFLIFAYVSLFHTAGMLNSSLGQSLLLLIALFWLFRAVLQIWFFGLDHWGSVAFLVVFLTGATLYGIPYVLTMNT